MQLKWTDLAAADLENIEAYIAENNGSTVAIDIVLNIIDSTHLILPDHPRAGRQGRVKHTRELVIEGLLFVVIYREHVIANSIEVLRVLHEAQQWPAAD